MQSRFFSALPRVGAVRLIGMGFPLLIGLGFVMAFHFEIGKKHLTPALDFASTLALTLLLPVIYALLVRVFEGRWPRELALRTGTRQLAVGAAVGFGLFTAVYAVFTAMGVAAWDGFNGFGAAAPLLLLAIIAGVGEELIFRGVVFRLLEESFGTVVALAVSAALFGLMHAGNPGATAVSTVSIAVEAGVMLAAAYAWSRSLWLPIGIHIAWNFTEGGIYGAAVSGDKVEGIFRVVLSKTASPLVTGGDFGPEASLVAVAICLCAGVAFAVAAVRAGRWRGASFRMMLDRADAPLRAATAA
jgi:hypothetical protein